MIHADSQLKLDVECSSKNSPDLITQFQKARGSPSALCR